MGLNIKVADPVLSGPIITVLGVGGAGGNAVQNMIDSNLQGVKFVVANTDMQVLNKFENVNKIQLGIKLTKGLGAGMDPEVGRDSAFESEDDIRRHLEGSSMLFITAGMGGGTGTGASPVIAQIAKELGVLVVGVVTKPFDFEGKKRNALAETGIIELQKHVDTLIIIPNQNLFRIANEETTFEEAFTMADEVLHSGVRGITDLITSPGLVNLDFADIVTVMRSQGRAMMGTGEAEGENRAIQAAEAAISNPLLDQTSMQGASGVLINITASKGVTLYEVNSAANRIREEIGDTDANIMFGSTLDATLENTIRVSVVATGMDSTTNLNSVQNNVSNSKNINNLADDVVVGAANEEIEDDIPLYDEYQADNEEHVATSHAQEESIESAQNSKFDDAHDNTHEEAHDGAQDNMNAGANEQSNHYPDNTNSEDNHFTSDDVEIDESLRDQLEEYAQQIKSNEHKNQKKELAKDNLSSLAASDPINSRVSSKAARHQQKPSIWKRMWDSLKSDEDIHNNVESEEPTDWDKNESEVQDIPNFLKKDK